MGVFVPCDARMKFLQVRGPTHEFKLSFAEWNLTEHGKMPVWMTKLF